MKSRVLEETVTKRVGVEWKGYGYFSTFDTEEEVFKWINDEEDTLEALEDTRKNVKLSEFEITVTIKRLS